MKRAITISLVMLLLLGMLIPSGCMSVQVKDKIAVIPLTGIISSQQGSLFFGPTITPGLVKKPIVVSMESMAASGGYYISTKADKIVALPGTLTGSIGVISQIPNVEGLYEKLGIKMQTFKGGKYKDMYSGLRELTPEEAEIMQRMTDEYYEQFVEVVAEGRGLSNEEVRSLATGQLYTGTEAQRLGLVDELGGLDTAIDLAAELAGVEAPELEYYQAPGLTLRSLFGLADAIQLRLWGLSGQDAILLETLSRGYPQPQFLYQG